MLKKWVRYKNAKEYDSVFAERITLLRSDLLVCAYTYIHIYEDGLMKSTKNYLERWGEGCIKQI
jgi:hypothetical protein